MRWRRPCPAGKRGGLLEHARARAYLEPLNIAPLRGTRRASHAARAERTAAVACPQHAARLGMRGPGMYVSGRHLCGLVCLFQYRRETPSSDT